MKIKDIFKRESIVCSPLEIEKEEYKFYVNYLQPGMTVLDVGANIGLVTLVFSKFVGKNGKVYAFEATPSTYEKLNAILEAGSVRNVKTFNKVISEQKGKAFFHIYPQEYASWNTLADRPLEDYGISVKPELIEEIETISLDDFCKYHQVEHIDLLKIDVEGAELSVLKGIENMLSHKKVGACLFEFGQTIYDMGIKPKELEDYLHSVGYKLRNLIKGHPTFPHDKKGLAQFAMLLAQPR